MPAPMVGLNPEVIATIVVTVSGIVTAVVVGLRKGVGMIKSADAQAGLKVQSAVLMENSTMAALTESNKELRRSVDRLGDQIIELKVVMLQIDRRGR